MPNHHSILRVIYGRIFEHGILHQPYTVLTIVRSGALLALRLLCCSSCQFWMSQLTGDIQSTRKSAPPPTGTRAKVLKSHKTRRKSHNSGDFWRFSSRSCRTSPLFMSLAQVARSSSSSTRLLTLTVGPARLCPGYRT